MRNLLLAVAFVALPGCVALKTKPAGAAAEPPPSCPAWRENRTFLSGQTVYFAPGNSSLSAEAKARIAQVADYMKANPVAALIIEGHGDGPGTDEQNLELGDRRAEVLRQELTRRQVDLNRIDALPVPGAPRKWRSAEFILLTPPE